ncbi:MAG: hypothetical protein LLG04_11335 [Parachlamydia sp.]|nr:hypothetical protein [Parachlamydia sp.]
MKLYAKDSPALLQVWEASELEVQQKLTQHNQLIAQLDFNALAAEIDNRASSVSKFKDDLRDWARTQQGSHRLQELLKLPNFARDFIAWQNELVHELQSQPTPALKPQLRLLSRKLVVFVNEVASIRGVQHLCMEQLTGLSRGCNPKPQLPAGAITLSPNDLNVLSRGGMKYDLTALAFQGPDDIARMAPRAQQSQPAAQQAQLPPVPQAVAKASPKVPAAQQQAKQAVAQPAQLPPVPQAVAKAPPVVPAAQPQVKQAAVPAQRVAQLPPVAHNPQPAAAAQNQLTLNHLQQALANINAPNQPAPQPQQVQAIAPANAPLPAAAANAPPAPAQNNISKPQAAAQSMQKSSGFVGFLKRCGNMFVQIVTYPFRLLKMLFTSNKQK